MCTIPLNDTNREHMLDCIVQCPTAPVDELQCLEDASYALFNNHPQPLPPHGKIRRDYCYNIVQKDGNSSLDEELNIFSCVPPSKVRRTRHHQVGTAMDSQSIAARSRRERFSDQIRILQSLVPNAEKLDTVSMLGQTLEYVRFLQHQVWQLYQGVDPELVQSSDMICEKWKDFANANQQAKMK